MDFPRVVSHPLSPPVTSPLSLRWPGQLRRRRRLTPNICARKKKFRLSAACGVAKASRTVESESSDDESETGWDIPRLSLSLSLFLLC